MHNVTYDIALTETADDAAPFKSTPQASLAGRHATPDAPLAAKANKSDRGRTVTLYNHIFFTNVVRTLAERQMTKLQLSEKSGVSISFLSDLTTGKGNPSLRVLESIAFALDVSLPYLLEANDLDKSSLQLLSGRKTPSQGGLPDGFVRITAVLPAHRAFAVQRWNDEAMKKIAELHEAAAKKGLTSQKNFSG